MPWTRGNDGLVLKGNRHYDVRRIRHLIAQLRQARNKPKRVCDMLDELLTSGSAPRALIWRLSKWCHWNDRSEKVAQTIAGELFHEIVCRRLLDKEDKPIPTKVIAEDDYQELLTRVVAAGRTL